MYLHQGLGVVPIQLCIVGPHIGLAHSFNSLAINSGLYETLVSGASADSEHPLLGSSLESQAKTQGSAKFSVVFSDLIKVHALLFRLFFEGLYEACAASVATLGVWGDGLLFADFLCYIVEEIPYIFKMALAALYNSSLPITSPFSGFCSARIKLPFI